MQIRPFLNLAYADMVRFVGASDTTEIDAWLEEKFEHEMSPQEKRQVEMRRMAKQIGEPDAQRDLMAAFGMAKR